MDHTGTFGRCRRNEKMLKECLNHLVWWRNCDGLWMLWCWDLFRVKRILNKEGHHFILRYHVIPCGRRSQHRVKCLQINLQRIQRVCKTVNARFFEESKVWRTKLLFQTKMIISNLASVFTVFLFIWHLVWWIKVWAFMENICWLASKLYNTFQGLFLTFEINMTLIRPTYTHCEFKTPHWTPETWMWDWWTLLLTMKIANFWIQSVILLLMIFNKEYCLVAKNVATFYHCLYKLSINVDPSDEFSASTSIYDGKLDFSCWHSHYWKITFKKKTMRYSWKLWKVGALVSGSLKVQCVRIGHLWIYTKQIGSSISPQLPLTAVNCSWS